MKTLKQILITGIVTALVTAILFWSVPAVQGANPYNILTDLEVKSSLSTWNGDALTVSGGSWLKGNTRVGSYALNPCFDTGIQYLDKKTNPTTHMRGIHTVLQAAQTTGIGIYAMVGGEFQAYILPTNTQDWTGSLRGSDSEIFTMKGSQGNIAGAYAAFAGATVMGASVDKLYGFYYGEVTITAPVNKQYGLYIAPLTSAVKNYAIFTEAGYIRLGNLPTSDPGEAEVLWSDNGTVKISVGD